MKGSSLSVSDVGSACHNVLRTHVPFPAQMLASTAGEQHRRMQLRNCNICYSIRYDVFSFAFAIVSRYHRHCRYRYCSW